MENQEMVMERYLVKSLGTHSPSLPTCCDPPCSLTPCGRGASCSLGGHSLTTRTLAWKCLSGILTPSRNNSHWVQVANAQISHGLTDLFVQFGLSRSLLNFLVMTRNNKHLVQFRCKIGKIPKLTTKFHDFWPFLFTRLSILCGNPADYPPPPSPVYLSAQVTIYHTWRRHLA